MISMKEYRQIVSELMDELPPAFYDKLTGGVIVSEEAKSADYAKGDDLYVMGQYQVYAGVRQIVMFKGSFDRAYPYADIPEARSILRGVLRHEFRHHIEGRGGLHGVDTLEAEDARQKQMYLLQHARLQDK